MSLKRIALALGIILLPSLMTAQIDRSKAPKPGPAPDVRVGKAHHSTLDNGMKVIVVENHKLPMVSVQIRFDHPPVAQGDIAGYQDLVGELLTAGTARRSKVQIDEMVDQLGAQLSGSTDGVFASSLKKNFPELMRLVYEVVAAPGFPVAEFEKARTRYLSNIKSRADDPDQISEVVGRVLTYGKRHPYGEVATEESLAKVTRDHLVAYYQHFFNPGRGYIVFVGDITEKEAMQQAKDLFGSWQGVASTSSIDEKGRKVVKGLGPVEFAGTPPKALAPRSIGFVDRAGSAQSVIKVVFPVELVPSDPMALPAQVMNTMLGGGVFNARLMQNLREARAYTYGAYSNIEADRWCGNFSAGCSVRNEVTDSAVTEIMYEIERMRNEPVTAEELSLAKSYMAGSFARSLEDPRTVARFALNIELYGLPADHYATYLKRLDTISVETIHAAAQRLLLPDNATVLVVGDKEQVANKLAPLSFTRSVVHYDINGDIYREKFEMPPAGMKADDVLSAYVKAIGGVEALGKVKTLRKEYEAAVPGMTVSLVEQHSTPNKYAMSLGNGPMVLQKLIFDGVRGKRSGMEGMSDLLDEDLEDARQSAYMFPELFYRELDYKALLNGVVEVEGRKCYRLFVQKSSGAAFTDYYDTETNLKVRRVENQVSEEGNFQVTTDYADYKAVNGVQFPHTIDQNAGMRFHFTAKSIEVNKPIDPTVFVVQ